MKRLNQVLVAVMLLLTLSTSAQKAPKLINSGEMIKEALKLHEDGKYLEAIEIYDQIGRNDTNYTTAQYEEAYSLYSLQKYDTVARMCRALIANEDYTGSDAYTLLGNALDDKKMRTEAIQVYKDALIKFPKSYLLHFNLGVAYYKEKRMDEAYESFKNALAIYPWHPTSHYFLGLINAEQKRWAPAMLAMNTCLMLGPNKNVESRCLAMLINIAKGDYEPDSGKHEFSEAEDPAFAKIDKLIDSKMAFRPDYEIATKMDDKLMKQMQLLLETMVDLKPKSDNFFVKEYVPFYTEAMEHKFIKTLLFYPYSSVDNELVTKWKSKNKKEIQEFEEWAGNFFKNISMEYTDTVNGQPYKFKRFFYDNHNVEVLGDYSDMKKEIPKGYFKVFFTNTVLAAEGKYDDAGKKQGKWISYYESGKLKSVANYKNGKPDGEFKEYFNNGNISREVVFKEGMYNGEVKEYFRNGALMSDEMYENGDQNGHAIYYYENGNPKAEADFKNNKAEGKITQYGASGYKSMVVDAKMGKKEGPLEEYHPNGVVSTKGNASGDNPDGIFKYYDMDGKLTKEGEYKNGKSIGDWKQYYSNGKISLETDYTAGTENYYDEDGLKYYETTFKDDKTLAYKAYDKAGKIIDEGKDSHGDMAMKTYYPNGKVSAEGNLKKGKRDGKWKFYYKNGGIKAIETYDNGAETGPYQSFYKNGQLKIDGAFKDGDLDGPYKKYFQNGKLEDDENVVNGKAEGDAYSYLSNGALSSHSYYHRGDEYKWQSYYFPDGKLDYEYSMDLTHMTHYLVYDTSGKVVSKYYNPAGTADFDVKYFNGKPLVSCHFDHGRIQGEHKRYYSNGQLEAVSHYINGIETGPYTKNFENGKVYCQGKYTLGKGDSLWSYYTMNGNLESKGMDRDGDYTGFWTWYYDNGKVEFISKFVDDDRDSISVYYAPDGSLRLKLTYDNGVLTGYTYAGKDGKDLPIIPIINETATITAYYANGNKSFEGSYKHGSRDGKLTYYYPDGKVQWALNYADGWHQGKQMYYYPDGKIEKEEEQLDDDLHGLVKTYDKTGAVKREQHYYMGMLHGPSKIYEGKTPKEYNYYYGVMLSEK